jgi:hypothetical protein
VCKVVGCFLDPGKSTLLRAMAAHEIRGIPPQCQILHVEQEVAGEECTVMEVGTCGGYVCV